MRPKTGWYGERYPPVSIFVPGDEGGPTLWGLRLLDYAAIVAWDLRTSRRTTVTYK